MANLAAVATLIDAVAALRSGAEAGTLTHRQVLHIATVIGAATEQVAEMLDHAVIHLDGEAATQLINRGGGIMAPAAQRPNLRGFRTIQGGLA